MLSVNRKDQLKYCDDGDDENQLQQPMTHSSAHTHTHQCDVTAYTWPANHLNVYYRLNRYRFNHKMAYSRPAYDTPTRPIPITANADVINIYESRCPQCPWPRYISNIITAAMWATCLINDATSRMNEDLACRRHNVIKNSLFFMTLWRRHTGTACSHHVPSYDVSKLCLR